MKRFVFAIIGLIVVLAAGAGDTYTVIVSLDGLRWDYPEAFNTPFLDSMARDGVKAVMSPSFPSSTFPNHYTLATGLTPDHHGIIANSFKVRAEGKIYSMGDRKTSRNAKYYGGEPIWLTAQRQGVKTGTIFWVGSDVAIRGQHPTYWKDYSKHRLTYVQRVDEVLRLLSLPEVNRPRLVMCYFEQPDGSGHHNGPISRTTRRTVEDLDTLLASMWQRIRRLDIAPRVNLIVTGDHGMTWTENCRAVRPSKVLPNTKWIDCIVGNVPANIYVKSSPRPNAQAKAGHYKEGEYVDSVMEALAHVDHIRAWRKADIPAYLGYGSNPNVGDVLVLPDVGWSFTDHVYTHAGGNHGYDHTASDMQVAFRAVGPDFKRGYAKTDRFPNVDIYPLLCYLLGIKPAPNDGHLTDLHDILAH